MNLRLATLIAASALFAAACANAPKHEDKPAAPAASADTPAADPKAKPVVTRPSYAARATVSDIAWLHGEWVSADNSMSEMFMPAAGGCILGTSRAVNDGETVHHEFMRLTDLDRGVQYQVSWEDWSHNFWLTSSKHASATFEDPHNDFPCKITYARTGESLQIDLAGQGKSKDQAMNFTLKLRGSTTASAAQPAK